MSGQLFISLLNPGIGIILAMAFAILWLNQRNQAYVALAAAGYGAMALGFLFQDIMPGMPMELQRIPSNFFFIVSALFLWTSVLWRYRIKAPLYPMLIVAGASFAALCWFLVVQPSLTNRIYSINIGLGIIAASAVFKLRKIRNPKFIDKVLFWVSFLAATNFIFRPILIVWLQGGYESYADYTGFQQSLYWATVQFTQALISVTIALILLVAVATDLIEELTKEARTDVLSGLANRRGFEDQASALLQSCNERGEAAVLLIVDIDHFKRINDNFGHAAGDSVIAAFGRMLRAMIEPEMVAGRIGGEEFAVFVPNVDPGKARCFAEELRKRVSEQRVEGLPDHFSTTASIGLAFSTHRGEELFKLLRRADRALYDAKDAGRDQVRLFSSDKRLVRVAQ
ncbi:GGDEF domain-containing protein [Nitratireductor indicus]|uniref:GGDEF domain-containing protein n=1 Tax=Nitratireductor indicus TaxID=721133 RepID=UPI0028753753|nr:GGDEF domain-containing protein [Nitratireductor indicus]MDS1135392.1 GGDEF domain-containing protein [Nitratireductor indicus]